MAQTTPTTDSATFINRPVAIAIGTNPNNQNSSVVTLTSETNEPRYLGDLQNCVQGLCVWINTHLRRETDCVVKNNQVVCTMNIRQEYLGEDVIPELRRRLGNYEGRMMAAGAGTGTNQGLGRGTGEEDYEEAVGT